MAEIWKPQSHEVLEYWVSTILDEASDLLNNWETLFIEEMAIRIDNKWPLTELQEKKLESIYKETRIHICGENQVMECEEVKKEHPEIKFEPCCLSCHEDDDTGYGDDLWFKIDEIERHVCCATERSFMKEKTK